ncbi:lasso peptide biosynthesis B2 protein [Nocardiopsis sp. NPDC050513]|uniref:lasso peptide biosynthesis B2 protein n=1 Tax=Nocardiopsis sp. NPDC050513 TaxID=3364338 RepID=UPI0037A84B5E
MTELPTVAVLTRHTCVLIDYRTGHTELRTRLPENRDTLVIIRHETDAGSWGTEETNAVLRTPSKVGSGWILAAIPATAVTVPVLFCGSRPHRFARMVRLACVGRRFPPATDAQAQHVVHAVRRISALFPARWACLEQSVTAALLLAMVGRRAEWRHGVATDPVRLHAWIEADGYPVEEEPGIDAYTPIYTPDGPAVGPGETLENTVE